jgi:NADP-dependent 3-hydroxy acid dehydrogenase YdfG
MTVLVSGNPNKGLAQSIAKIYPDAEFVHKSAGCDLTSHEGQLQFAKRALNHDVIIINAALWKFQQVVLLDIVHKTLVENEKKAHVVCIGSTTDRVKKGTMWLYNADKKALRDYSNSLSILGVWDNKPRVSYISFGTLSNNQHKHPDRICMDIDVAASYIKWIIDQPAELHINELSIDPVQG